jgi:GTP-binding protein
LTEEVEPQCKVVLLGKPNVGKSSLLNLLLQEERSIVADVPGTTREPIIGKVTFYKEDIQITDTPGVRRKSRVDEPLEEIMVKRAFTAMDKGNIVLLLIDASEGTISDQELKLAFYAFENYKAVILLFNKNDLVNDELEEQMKFETDVYKYFFDKLPQLHISCKTGKNIGKILPLVQQVWHAYSQRFDDDALTFLFKEALVRKPLYSKTIPLKVYRARQSSTAPIVLIVTVNEPKWFGSSQLAYFDKLLRKEYDLKGVPIRYVLKKG